MSSSYRIIKLRSGEDIITKILGQKKGRYIVERPMVFKSTISFDAFGQKREITVLKDWLQFTNAISVEIPKDHIAIFLTPDGSASKLYDLEKEKEDLDPTENKIIFSSDDDEMADEQPTEGIEKIDDSIPNLMDYLKNIVVTNIEIPPFVLDEIMNGLYGDGESMSDVYTGDEDNREDFGNKWTDWEIDPEDYIK